MQVKFHHLARAIIIKDNKLLIANFLGKHSFLPGGHIEVGESVTDALVRELKEELGISCVIDQFVGILENEWESPEFLHYEINHLFRVSSEGLHSNFNPVSNEAHLSFHWITPSEENFRKHNVLPFPAVWQIYQQMSKTQVNSIWISQLANK